MGYIVVLISLSHNAKDLINNITNLIQIFLFNNKTLSFFLPTN